MTRRSFLGAGGACVGVAASVGVAPSRSIARQSGSGFDGLRGRVILPNDPAYGEARRTFNSRTSRYPAAIVVCADAAEVGRAVRWSRRRRIEIRVRSGGHSYEGYSVADGALVIDVGGMADVAVDPGRGVVVVGAGARLIDVNRALGAYGLAVPAGTCPGVGIAGLTLGGGIGYLARSLGLTCDALLAVDFVDTDGRTNWASDDANPDLFWALRGGGGGNFGIATAFAFRATPLTEVVLCRLEWPWGDAAAVLDAWQRWAPFADPRLTVGLAIPGGGSGVVSATGLFTGPASELPPLLAPVLAAGAPAAPTIWTAPFVAACEQLGGPSVAHAAFKNASAMVYEPLGPEAIAALVAWLRVAPASPSLVGFFPLGGAVAATGPAATAFPHRRALFDMHYQAYWGADADGAAGTAWVRGIRDAMRRFARGAYANYADADLADWATDYYGANLPRLEQAKAAWDPDGVFGGPQALKPAAE
jgi:FAD/FMN-containing dehydrogenase